MSLLSLTNPVVQAYIVHSAILALKVLLMSGMTAAVRLTVKVFANPEDAGFLGGKVKFDHPTVERVRRAHLNDLENIPAFWILAAFYVATNPMAAWAILLFRVYTACRILHSFVYIFKIPQPARGLAFGIPYGITMYMGAQVVLYFITSI